MSVKYLPATVLNNRLLVPGHSVIKLKVDAELAEIRAGQFLTLRCNPADKHSLLRPFSILDIDSESNVLSVYYKHLGRLSSQLSHIVEGAVLDCLFPLGKEFPVDPKKKRIALVGGGVGLAPMLFLAKQLLREIDGIEVTGFFGGNTETDLVSDLLKEYSFPMKTATMDGSAGFKGTVIALFEQFKDQYDVVYSCGPNPMMAALKEVLPDSIEAWASLEEYMACGVGACYGCPAIIEEDGSRSNLRVCKDGPVFNLRSVVFE